MHINKFDDILDSNNCSEYQFQCDDGDCIHISQVCNFKQDCIDGSDEYCGKRLYNPLKCLKVIKSQTSLNFSFPIKFMEECL